MGIPPTTGTHITQIYPHMYKHTYTQMYTTHVNENGGEKRNYGGRLMERVAKMRPWERKVENELERGLLRGAKERCSVL